MCAHQARAAGLGGGRGGGCVVDEAAGVFQDVGSHVPHDVEDGERYSDGHDSVRHESAGRLDEAVGRGD